MTTQDYSYQKELDGVEVIDLKVNQSDDGSFTQVAQFGESTRFAAQKKLQFNHSILLPGALKAWHRHCAQKDYWYCFQPLLVGLYDDRRDSPTKGLSRRFMLCNQLLVIPENLHHGVANLSHEPRHLFYMVDNFFNPVNPDEYRDDYNKFVPKGFWQMTKG